jgi:hypothetical protein
VAQPIANTFRLCKAAIRNFSPVFNAANCDIVSACPHNEGFRAARNKLAGYAFGMLWDLGLNDGN